MPRGACRVLSGMHSRYPVQGVMPTEARPGRVVDGLVGDGLVRTAPEPLLSEELRERPRVDAARVTLNDGGAP